MENTFSFMSFLTNNTIFNDVFSLQENRNKEKTFQMQNFEDLKNFWKFLSAKEKEELFLIHNDKLIDFALENLLYLQCYQVFFK